jgi:hypothetical protein
MHTHTRTCIHTVLPTQMGHVDVKLLSEIGKGGYSMVCKGTCVTLMFGHLQGSVGAHTKGRFRTEGLRWLMDISVYHLFVISLV